MGLKEEIAAKRKEIIVDSYPMSIGEVMEQFSEQILNAASLKQYLKND